jgi:hypothetical protein
MSTDDELMDFEMDLWEALEEALLNVNLDHWRETGRPTLIFFEGLKLAIQEAHHPLINKYRNTPVEPILLESQSFIFDIAWAGMNVPLPIDPDLHAVCVTDNARYLYNIRIYAGLRTEMIMTNHNAAIIQRIWRRAVTNPEHLVCRRRLEYEFANLEQLPV